MVRHVEPEAFGEPADARTIRTAFFSGTYIQDIQSRARALMQVNRDYHPLHLHCGRPLAILATLDLSSSESRSILEWPV